MLIIRKPVKGLRALDDLSNAGGYSGSSSHLSQLVALLALKYRRAPLPVSHGSQKALQKALKRQSVVDGAELVDLARRYFFLGKAQMLPAELRKRTTPIWHSLEFDKQVSTERQTQSETGVCYQCL